MKKTKTALAVLLVSVLVSAGVLATMYEYYAGQLRASTLNIRNDYRRYAEETFAATDTPEKGMLDFTKKAFMEHSGLLPYFAVITDQDGNLLAETQNILFCRMPSEDGLHTLEFCAVLTPEITQRMIEAATEIAPKHKVDTIYVKSAGLAEQNGVYTPVRAEIGCKTPNSGNYTTVSFSDQPISFIAEWPQLMLYYPLDNVKLRNTLFFLRDQAYSLKDRLSQYYAVYSEVTEDEAIEQSDIVSQLMEQCIYSGMKEVSTQVFPVTVGGKTCFFILQYVSRLPGQVFQWYYLEFAQAGVLLLFASCAAMLLALWFVKRKSVLETSRYSFLAAAAHELKTPLNVMVSAGECIRDGVSPEKNAAYADMILHEGERMRSLLENMLQENRLITADGVKKTPTDLSELVLRETSAYADAAAQKRIHLTTEVVPGLTAAVDAELLSVALDNFLSNAVKYAPEDAKITVRAGRNGRKATVIVHNTGSRISPAALPHVWEELYREDTVRGDGAGSGLGLSIAGRVFKLHRMKYGCTSNEAGTSFWFTLSLSNRLARQVADGPTKASSGKRSSAERLCIAAVLCVAASLPTLASGLYTEWNPGFVSAIILAIAGEFCGLLGILSAALSWREKTRLKRKALLVITVIALLLPPLIYAFFYVAGSNGW